MSIAGSPDIFQDKMSELMETMEYVRAYLDDLLCISKLSLEDLQGLPSQDGTHQG
jgi:hypothetical protein